jgi:cytochrome c
MIRNALVALAAAAVAALSFAGPTSAAGDAAAGADVFKKKCKSCHEADKHKTGPMLGGAYGRKAGSTDFPRYKGLVDADFAWDDKLLDEYLVDPGAFVKAHTKNTGTSMTFKLPDEKQRADVIEYLKTLK